MDREILPDAGGRIGSLLRCSPRPRLALPRAHEAAFLLLLCAWPWIGLFGREPWKADEAYSFGLVWSMVQGKGWLFPVLAGEPFVEKPPLFYWVAALCVRLFGGAIPAHEAARIAVVAFVYLTGGFLYAAGRVLLGAKRAALVPALLAGSVGLFDKVHILVTDVSLLAGLAIGLYGLASGERRPIGGGLALGLGTGVAFLSKGLLGPGILALTAAGLAIVPSWRTRRRLESYAIAAAVFAPALLAWPIALYIASPERFREWLWVNNLGRFFGFVRLGERHGLWFYPLTLAWLAFPLWPFALAAGRAAWTRKDVSPALALPGVAFLVTLIALMAAAQSRALYALPALLPLALLAAAGLDEAIPRFVGALQRVSPWLFGAAIVALWLAWLAVASGFPWASSVLTEREPGFVLPVQPAPLAFAAAGTALCWLAVRLRPADAENAVRNWAAGLTTCWLLVLTLWLPYLDYGMGYRAVATSLAAALPRDGACVTSLGLGESQRAMFEYYAGLATRRLESGADLRECAWLLTQESGHPRPRPSGARWREAWEGARPGDIRERFHLYRAEGGN